MIKAAEGARACPGLKVRRRRSAEPRASAGTVEGVTVAEAPAAEVSVIKSELPIRWDRQSYDAHLADGIRLIKLLDVMPAATQLRIVVRDRLSGKLGSLGIPLDRIHPPR